MRSERRQARPHLRRSAIVRPVENGLDRGEAVRRSPGFKAGVPLARRRHAARGQRAVRAKRAEAVQAQRAGSASKASRVSEQRHERSE